MVISSGLVLVDISVQPQVAGSNPGVGANARCGFAA